MSKLKIGYFIGGYKGLSFFENVHKMHDVAFVCAYVNDKSYESMTLIPFKRTLENYPTFSKSDDVSLQDADLIFIVGWPFLINPTMDNMIVFHDSHLPYYRGWNPTVSQLINGEPVLGASAIFPTPEVDAGDLIRTVNIAITYPIKIREAYELVIKTYTKMFSEIVNEFMACKLYSRPQMGNPSYSIWRADDDYYINWNKSSAEIKRFVDAVGWPYLGARTKTQQFSLGGNSVIKEYVINECEVVADSTFMNRGPGKVFKIIQNDVYVICGSGILKLTDYQRWQDNSKLKGTLNRNNIKKIRTRFI